jgi:predicted nucleic acid-binding protein
MTAPVLLVVDTNVVLDLFVFRDPRTEPLAAALARGHLEWLATAAMREELVRVLAYAHIAARLAANGIEPSDVLEYFDARTRMVAPPPKAMVTCTDADDQKFVDLAVTHKCLLLSKDAAVLALRRRLIPFEVGVFAALPPASSYSLIRS